MTVVGQGDPAGEQRSPAPRTFRPTSPDGAEVDSHAILEASPDLIVLADRDGIIRWVGANLAELFQWTPAALVGTSLFELLAKEANRSLQMRALDRVRSTPGVHGPIEETVVTGDGRLREIEMMVTNALDDPRVGMLVAVCRDITDRDSEMEGLRQRESWASSLLRGSTDLIIVCDRHGGIVYVSPSAEGLLGLDPDSTIGRNVADLVHPEDLLTPRRRGRALDRVLGTGPGRRPVLRFQMGGGNWRRLRVERATGARVGDRTVLLTCRDVSEEEAVSNLLDEQSLLLERIARGAPLGDILRGLEEISAQRISQSQLVVGFHSPDGTYHCNGAGLGPQVVEHLRAAPPEKAEPGTWRETDEALLGSPHRRDQRLSAQIQVASGNRWTSVWVVDLTGASGNVTGRLCLLRAHDEPLAAAESDLLALTADLATIALERHDLQSRLSYGALHDELTGLPNRRYLLGKLSQVFGEDGARGGLLFVDLDRFKLINDSLGHEAGDNVLRETTARFRRTLRPDDIVARVGGDEFVVLCPNVVDVDDVTSVADRLVAVLAEPIDLPEGRVVVSASIGVAYVTAPVDPAQVLQDADLAMYEAKEQGRSRTALFHDGLRDRAIRRLEMESALRDALRREEMELFYQPMVRLETGHISGVEALLRWHRPGFGLVEPADFVPTATDTGLILPIGRWVIAEAAAAAARWPDLEVACNMSARQLTDADLVHFVADVLEENGVEPQRMCLEMTEADLITDPDRVLDQLDRFEELGVRLAIDDFGTGFATLDYLRRFSSADVLKVDASFVAGVNDPDSHDLAIVSAAMVLARNLGFETVAEGVERPEQREILRELGCDIAQGYLFSPPVTMAEIDEMLARRASW